MLEGLGGKRPAGSTAPPVGPEAKRPRPSGPPAQAHSSRLARSEGVPASRASSSASPAPRQALPPRPAAAAPAVKRGGYRDYRKFDAAGLALALKAILRCPPSQRGPAVMDRIARQLQQSPEYIASWVNTDGSPAKKMYYLARMDGYLDHRDELQSLLRQLGHGETAEALPAEVPPHDAAHAAGPSTVRRNLTAADVLGILTDAAAGKAVPEIMAGRGLTKSTVNRWLGKNKWQGENLAQALSRMEGYETHRPALQRLALERGLHQGDLPEPAARRKQHVTAEVLCRALGALVQRLEHPQPGQNPDTLEALGEAVGLPKNTVAKWLKADGSPRIALASFARLPDYAECRAELQGLLARLKHRDVAATLPSNSASVRTHLTAGLLVQALEQVGRGADSTNAVATALNLSGTGLRSVMTVKGRTVNLVEPDRLLALPGYRAERGHLQAALRALGMEDAAKALPEVQVSAAELLQGLRGKHREAAAALADMRKDRSLSAEAAAQRHGLPPDEFGAAVRPGGLVNDRARVEARLTGFEPHLARGLDDLLAMLQRAAGGDVASGSGAAAAQSVMKRVQLAPAAHEPAKVFIVPQGETTGPKRSQLENLYAANTGLVRGPRSYDGERERQALRWLSTVFRLLIPDSSEVQCYFDEHTGAIAVSAGKGRDLKQIQSLLAGGDFRAMARGELDKQIDTMSEREYRHVQKLFGHLKARRKGEAYDPAADLVFDAILKNAFVVPIASFRDKDRVVALHAERRLNEWSRKTYDEPVDPARLAGTMRPCGTCAEDLALPDDARRGPFWRTHAAEALIDHERALQRAVDDGIPTYVTLTREGKTTIAVDTDSDSDTGH